ncbi:trypsin delta-like [Schistocerca piceifrons]|uniref:trypsin delta-like n=1 Tax=Schistocerca piceifrons TaxID=274613 RepID=UPI001F5F087C|nr:trypsin delta-like [Schistocerca piceifrons]
MQLSSSCCLLPAALRPPQGSGDRLKPQLDGRILGGEPVDITQYPWQISLQVFGYHSCGGSIISPTWVLTATHCVARAGVNYLAVRAGSSVQDSGGTIYNASSVIAHEKHNSTSHDYDIAFAEISGSFSFDSNVQVVSLASSELTGGTEVTTTG